MDLNELSPHVLEDPELHAEAAKLTGHSIVALRMILQKKNFDKSDEICSTYAQAGQFREQKMALLEAIWAEDSRPGPLFRENGSNGAKNVMNEEMSFPEQPTIETKCAEPLVAGTEETPFVEAPQQPAKRKRGRPPKNPQLMGQPAAETSAPAAPRKFPAIAKPAPTTTKNKPNIFGDIEVPPAKPNILQEIGVPSGDLATLERKLQTIEETLERVCRTQSLLCDMVTAVGAHLGRAVFQNTAQDVKKLMGCIEELKAYYGLDDEKDG